MGYHGCLRSASASCVPSVFSVLVFPQRKVDVLKARLEAQALACAEKCRLLVEAFNARQQNVDETLVADLVKDVWDNHALLENIRRHESLIYRKTFRENFPRKVAVLSRSAEHLRNMVRSLNALDDEGYEIIMAREPRKNRRDKRKSPCDVRQKRSPGRPTGACP